MQQDLTIPEQDWRKLLSAASGDAALLYVFLRTGGTPEQADIVLRLSKTRMECASAALKQMGLWPETAKIMRPAQPPVYTEADLLNAQKTGFPQLLGDAQRRLGKVLSTEEAKVLLSIYDYLGLPAEVISLLITLFLYSKVYRGKIKPMFAQIEE